MPDSANDNLTNSVRTATDLKALTIAELHRLYRSWPERHNGRRINGRESMSFFYEGAIVKEMLSRKIATKGEELKIDYCVTHYSDALSNMSDLFSRPVQVDNDKIYPDSKRDYTPEDLTALISLYKNYRDIIEREILVEYVDLALDYLEKENFALNYLREEENPVSSLRLLSEIVELRRKEIIRLPGWITEKLEFAVTRSSSADKEKDFEVAPALLTMHILNNDPALERKAIRVINRCYRSAFDGATALGKRIENLHTAVTCADYVSRFSVRKSASLWDELTDQVLWNKLTDQTSSARNPLTPCHIFQLLEIANECEDYANIPADSKEKLNRMLEEMVTSECPGRRAYSKIAKLRF